MKPRELFELVGISYRTFKRWIFEGRIHVVRTPTGRIRVPYSEVERIFGKKQERLEQSYMLVLTLQARRVI